MTKKTIARKLRTQAEIKHKVPIFQTKNWNKRAKLIQIKVKNKIEKAKKRKIERLKKLKNIPKSIKKRLSTAEKSHLKKVAKRKSFLNKIKTLS
jgi:hypothetical protein